MFASATIEQFAQDYGLDEFEYESRDRFFDNVGYLLQHTVNREGDREFPIYRDAPESYLNVEGSDRDPDDIPPEVVAEIPDDSG